MTDDLTLDATWVPAACTLPTGKQPLRRAEFDDLFAQHVLCVSQVSPLQLYVELRPDPAVAARAADLAANETGCYSFITFCLTITDGSVSMTVSADQEHGSGMAALGARARPKS